MINIYDISGNIILSVPITQECEREEELMKSDQATLSWSSSVHDELPIGAYILYNGEKLSLLEPYKPEQKSDAEYYYKPIFQSVVIAWQKHPFFMYTYLGGSISSRETDCSLTDSPSNFMSKICDSIKQETGEEWTYTVDSDLKASASISFSSTDIYSALNSIANEFETEWYADKLTKTVHLGKASFGTEIELRVGDNVNTPNVTKNSNGYYTRFYAFGSTRNINQGYQGANANNIVNKRLTLDPSKYPLGYKDIRSGLSDGEIFSKILIFDDIYPSSELTISDVRARLMYRMDSDGKKVQIGTDADGNPIYDQYSVWYFQIPDYTFDEESVIDGKTLSVNFQSGALQGREFELIYHKYKETLSNSDGVTFEVKVGDFEVCFIEENTYIIPAMTGLVPSDGDSIILFNIVMPEAYKTSAYTRLESELDKEIERLSSDRNNYEVSSNPVAFHDNNPSLTIGRNVKYINGSYTYSTRVIRLVTKMDYSFEQTITVGNEQVKGNTQQLKEEVASANKDINLLSVFNDMTQSIQQAYNRTQQQMLDGFARIGKMWQFDEESKDTIYSEYNVYSKKAVSAKGFSDSTGGGGASALYQLNDVLKNDTEDGVQGAEKDKVLMFNGTHWYAGDAKGKVVAVKVGQEEYKPSEDGIVTLPEFAKVVDKTLTVDKFIGALEGNADTATKLKNALTIQKNKTDVGVFDGSEAKTVNIEVPTKVSELENDSKFLTEHQKLYALTIQGNGKQLGVYTPNEAAKSINITPSGIGAAASSHTHVISDVTNLQAALDSKLNASIFTELFEKVLLSDGVTYAIRAKYGFYSDSFVSAKGANSSTGGSTGGAASIYVGSTLYTPDGEGIIHLPAYPTVPTALKNPYALTIQKNGITQGVYDGSVAKEINLSVPTKVSELTNDSNFLTAHQTLYALTIQGNGTTIGTYTPNSEDKSINITAAGIGAAATTHKQAYTADACTTYTTDNENMGVTPAAVKKAIGLFEPKAHTHNVLGTVTAGSSSTPIYFNAGVPTAVDKTDTFNALVNSITVGSATPKDEDYYISQYSGGGTTTTTYHRRPHSALYAYIKGKAEGTWGINISGNAATATKLQTARKIWGQAFDGSADVSGAMTGVTSITIGDCVITYDSANKGLKFSTGIYSEQYVSAKGANSSAGGSTGGAASIKIGSDLYTPDGEGIIHLPAYPTVPTALKNPYALTIQKNGITQGVYDGSVAKTVNITVPTKVSELNNDANYLTAHQTLYALTIQGNGTELGVYTPNSAAKSINITAAGIGAASATHTHAISQVTGLQEALSDKYSSTVSRTANTVLAAPDGSNGVASFRKLVVNDLPSGVFHLRSNVSSLNDLGDYNKQNGLVYIHNESAPSLAAETPFAYGCVLNMNYDAASANIGISYLGDMYFRNRWWSAGGGSWHAWRKILHSYNYTDYTVKKDGTGASGTWGINVSGNAATATKLNNYYSTRPSNANLAPDGSGGMCKFIATSTMTSNRPAVDGHILHFFWDTTAGWDAQLMIPNNGNPSYEPQWRGQNNGTWGNWISLVTSGTIGNYNAGSATKLQTARTIWGQSFNGTANISGAMTGVTSITTNGSFSFYPVPSDTSNYYLTWGGSSAPFKMHNYGTITFETSTYIKMSANQATMYIQLEADAGTNINSPNAPALSLKRTTTDGGTFIRFFPFNQTSQYWMAGADWQYRFGIYYGGSTEVSFFDSSGNFATIGGVTAKASSSDIRLKRDLTEYDALSIVRSHRSVKYHWNETAKRNSEVFNDNDWHYGLIAQELQREHPQLVKDVFGDYLTIDYERLIPILWRAVQQLAKRNEELEMKLNEERRD